MYDFAKEMNFDVKSLGRKSTWVRTLINLLKSPAIMVPGVQTQSFYHLILMKYVID